MDVTKRIQAVFKAEAEAILAIKINEEYEKVIKIMQECQGKVLTTGIGKAGFIARKFAATLCSTATPAAFIHPAESAHGDLGLIDKKDCLIAFSTSGKSNEVLEMLELSRHLGLETIIGVTSHPDSELRRLCNVILDMGIIEEPCRLGLTPTASIAVMLAIGDALALTLMDLKGVTRQEYGLRHHGGYLGRKSRLENNT
jgi:arabinose-5-phosphate isomerase